VIGSWTFTPFTVHRSPLTVPVHRSPFTVHRSLFVCRSPVV
jgi:hypothetical protein